MTQRSVVFFLGLVLSLSAGCPSRDSDKTQEKSKGSKASAAASSGKAGSVTAVLTVGKISGSGVEVKPVGGDWQSLAVGKPVEQGSTLRTPKGARARLALDDGTVVHLDEHTQIVLEQPGKVTVSRGAVLAEVTKSSTGGTKLTFATDAGTVKVKGTRLHL